MIDIFVNYRTFDASTSAALLDIKLGERFGHERVFRDTRTLEIGRAFPEPLLAAVGQCHVLVVVIGPRWLERDAEGQRRIDDPTDYVRREIASGLQRDIIVLPVRVEDAPQISDADALPSDVAALVLRHGLEIRRRHEDEDVEQLLRQIERYVPPRYVPPPPSSYPAPARSVGNIQGSSVTFGDHSPVINIGKINNDERRS